jgi:hypothetical protein
MIPPRPPVAAYLWRLLLSVGERLGLCAVRARSSCSRSAGGSRASSNCRRRSAARPPGGSGRLSPGRFMLVDYS